MKEGIAVASIVATFTRNGAGQLSAPTGLTPIVRTARLSSLRRCQTDPMRLSGKPILAIHRLGARVDILNGSAPVILF
jgi:hypothetical protein